MTYRKTQEPSPEYRYVKSLGPRKSQTCFGLADEILDQMEKGVREQKKSGQVLTAPDENTMALLPRICIDIDANGTNKINAAAFLAANALSHQLVGAGQQPDPFFAYPELGKRVEGSYWVGPFKDEERYSAKSFWKAS